MVENPRPPVAIRIVRPYQTEEELFENELETFGKTSVVLIGAHARPAGVILRFEVTLASGATMLRGEGRVLVHKENAFRGQPGLTLRFTRLDPKSKAVVDRATSLREARAQPSGSPPRSAPRTDSPIAAALTASTPAPSPVVDQEAAAAKARAAAREKANANARANAKRTGSYPVPRKPSTSPPRPHEDAGSPRGLTPPPIPVAVKTDPSEQADQDIRAAAAEPIPVTSASSEVEETSPPKPESLPTGIEAEAARTELPPDRIEAEAARTESSPDRIEAPPDRAELLARLRERAAKLPRERVEEILSARTSR